MRDQMKFEEKKYNKVKMVKIRYTTNIYLIDDGRRR